MEHVIQVIDATCLRQLSLLTAPSGRDAVLPQFISANFALINGRVA